MSATTRLRRTLVAATAASMMILGAAPAAHAQTNDSTIGAGGDGGQGGVGLGLGLLSCLVQVQGDCATGNADASGGNGGGVIID